MSILDPHPMDSQSFWNGSPKTMFYMGLFLGLAVASILALAVLLGTMMSGRTFGVAANAGNTVAYNGDNNPSPTPTPSPTPVAGPVKPVDEKADHIIGAKNAKVTLIEYSDFQCPYCGKHEPAIAQALKDFPKDVRVVYRHYPLTSIHPNAQKAAEASECAAKLGGEGAFWKMHDQLFAQQTALSPTLYETLAKGLGLDTKKFNDCVNSGATASRITADVASGDSSGVGGTPATFVNGKLIEGAVPYDQLKQAIQSAGATS